MDFFRVLAGLLSAGYFVRLLLETRDYSSPAGFLDHSLVGRMFWHSRLGLFQPGLPEPLFYAAYALGLGASLAIAAGWRPKSAAGLGFLIAVSASRWNLVVMEIDDIIVSLFLFWLLLLPIGRTLVLQDWRKDPGGSWKGWLRTRVPGATIRMFQANILLIYVVASLWKLTSPMWRSGFALYATLRLPIAYWPDLWKPEHIPLLAAAGYAAMAVELSLPVMLLMPRGHALKRLGLLCQAALHLGIAALIRIPFANLGLLAATVLFFRDEIMERLGGERGKPFSAPAPGPLDKLAAAYLLLVTLSVARHVPVLGALSREATAVLWLAGSYQDYRLFNWIDRKNYRGEARVVFRPKEGEPRDLDPRLLAPHSMRSALLESYLFGPPWIVVPWKHRDELRQSLLERSAARFCRQNPLEGTVRATALVQRLVPEDPGLTKGEEQFVMEFECSGGKAAVKRTFLDILRELGVIPR